MDIIYIFGWIVGRMGEPLVIILALILGIRIKSKVTLIFAAVGAAVLNTLISGMIDIAPESFPWVLFLFTGSVASLIWFFVVYLVANYRRKRRGEDVGEAFE